MVRSIPTGTAAVRHDESDALFAKFVSHPNRRLDYSDSEFARARGVADEDMFEIMARALDGKASDGPGAAFAAMKPDLVKQANGAYGQVFVYRATPRVREALRVLRASAESFGNFVPGARPGGGGLVAVKLEPIAFMAPGAEHGLLRDKVREHVIHAYLSNSECRTAPDGARWCARDVVPQLYWAGQLESLNFMITVMEGIDGESIYRMEPTKNLANQLEQATHALWAFGVVHQDLHAGNVVVERATGKLKILDFGRAMYAPRLAGATSPAPSRSPSRSLSRSPSRSLSRSPSRSQSSSSRSQSSSSPSSSSHLYRSSSGRFAPTAAELRSPGLRRRVEGASDQELTHRGLSRYNPNSELMNDLFGYVRSKEKAAAEEETRRTPPRVIAAIAAGRRGKLQGW
jgi:serine/threonine protein kinase